MLDKNTPQEWEIENKVAVLLFLKERKFDLVRKSLINLTDVIKQKTNLQNFYSIISFLNALRKNFNYLRK